MKLRSGTGKISFADNVTAIIDPDRQSGIPAKCAEVPQRRTIEDHPILSVPCNYATHQQESDERGQQSVAGHVCFVKTNFAKH